MHAVTWRDIVAAHAESYLSRGGHAFYGHRVPQEPPHENSTKLKFPVRVAIKNIHPMILDDKAKINFVKPEQ